MGSKIFTSEDVGAPSLSGSVGSLINVFKKCLVEGYGEKTSLGWTIPFEDAPNYKCVFRMPEGTRTFLQIYDNAIGFTASCAKINAFETMSNVSTGIHPAIEYNYAYSFIHKSATLTDAVKRKWRIIGDGRGFYFFVSAYSILNGVNVDISGLSYHVYYIGDYIPYRQEEKNVFHISCDNINVSYNYFSPSAALAIGAENRIMRNLTNEKGSVFCGYGSCNSYSTARFGNNVNLSPLAGRWMYLPITIHDATNILGTMPGIFHPLYKFPVAFNINDYAEFYESDSDGIVGYSFVSQTATSFTYSNCQRLMIVLGDNFRNAN